MLRIGLTGGIASGKSAASDYFASLGIPVIDTDLISRELVQPGTGGLQRIVETFGESVLDDKDALDRPRLREIVFASDIKRRRLEDLLHPAIRDRVEELVAEIANAPYVIIVIPLLFESRYPIPVDRVLVIDTDEQRQLDRLMQRDDISIEQARGMLDAQTSRQARIRQADDVVSNDGSLEELQAQLLKLHHDYLGMAGKTGK
jgi:dephospho-CoA kinase